MVEKLFNIGFMSFLDLICLMMTNLELRK